MKFQTYFLKEKNINNSDLGVHCYNKKSCFDIDSQSQSDIKNVLFSKIIVFYSLTYFKKCIILNINNWLLL